MTKIFSGPLREVISLFLRLGFTAFGGPAAHIAMMEDETVRRRQWLTREQFLDLLGAASVIPGPSSTELAIYLGFRRAGWRGLVAGGVCFILPAALMVAGIAWAQHTGVTKVEVRLDGGGWQPTQLTTEVSKNTWRMWRAFLDLRPGSHTIECRATDGTGYAQTGQTQDSIPDGATGLPAVTFTVA